MLFDACRDRDGMDRTICQSCSTHELASNRLRDLFQSLDSKELGSELRIRKVRDSRWSGFFALHVRNVPHILTLFRFGSALKRLVETLIVSRTLSASI